RDSPRRLPTRCLPTRRPQTPRPPLLRSAPCPRCPRPSDRCRDPPAAAQGRRNSPPTLQQERHGALRRECAVPVQPWLLRLLVLDDFCVDRVIIARLFASGTRLGSLGLGCCIDSFAQLCLALAELVSGSLHSLVVITRKCLLQL